MLIKLLSKIHKHKNQAYGIYSAFFEIGDIYKVKEKFVCRSSVFIKGEELKCIGNFLSWYDGYFVITFKNAQDELKNIYINENILIKGTYRSRPDIDRIKELQSYEKYFERL